MSKLFELVFIEFLIDLHNFTSSKFQDFLSDKWKKITEKLIDVRTSLKQFHDLVKTFLKKKKNFGKGSVCKIS